MTSAGRPAFSITRAIVWVLPLPVTPSRVWARIPASRPEASLSMACGWSPVGRYSLLTWKLLRVSIQVPPVQFLVDALRLEDVLDVVSRLLERDVLADVEALVGDPGVHLALPRIIRREHQSLIARVAAVEVFEVPGSQLQVDLGISEIPLDAAPLLDETGGLGQQLHEAVGPLVGLRVRPEAALRVDHGSDERGFQAVLGAHLPDGLLVAQREIG